MNSGSLRVATWNVNGLRARVATILEWLGEFAPDVVLLQETKIQDQDFPRANFEEAGYNLAVFGQKSFNGVAILSKLPLEDVVCGLPEGDEDTQARWIEATVVPGQAALRVCGLYAPNGNPAPGEKYAYKLAWMERLRRHARKLRESEDAVVLGGDFNVIPQGLDANRPQDWQEDALFLPESRAALRRILHEGWTDAYRALYPDTAQYTFWDYQGRAWERDNGIRIDHLLLSPQAADRLEDAGVEQQLRGKPKPSDHVPVWCELRI